MKKMPSIFTSVITACALSLSFHAYADDKTYITIGTGGQTGVYYQVGQAVCKLVNRANEDVKCTAPSTGGSIDNINAVREGNRDMGVAQSDWQYNAYYGKSKFEGNAYPELRSVFSIHPEPVTVLARRDANIKHFDDLKGAKVNIGNPGSGQRGTMEVIMAAKGWTTDDFKLASELKSSEQAAALCDNNVDAIVFVAGHPNGSIQEAATSCDTVLVSVDGPVIQDLIANNPFYAPAIIPGDMYKGNPDDVKTFGVGATMVSSSQVDQDTVYEVVKAVFENIDRFRKLHPAFANLDPEKMIKNNLSAPLHEGAKRYYKEKGWM